MPINVRIVSKEAFKKWVADAKKKYASKENNTVRIAEAGNSAK